MAEVSKSKAVQALYDRYVGDDPDRVAAYERAVADTQVGQLVHDLRIEAGLSQKELADRVGTKQSVISRLEDADYDGHSLAMLRRIAAALGRSVVVDFPPIQPASVGDKPKTKATRPTKAAKT